MLAMPQAEFGKAINFGLDFEQKCFFSSPDRVSSRPSTIR